MSRAQEGTTLAGYRCDEAKCGEVAVLAPCVMIPYENVPVDIKAPIMCLIDVHVCMKHWKAVKPAAMLSKDKTDSIEKCASDNGGRPDFFRMYLRPVRCHSEEFLTFQQRAGLVPEKDALVEGAIDGLDGL